MHIETLTIAALLAGTPGAPTSQPTSRPMLASRHAVGQDGEDIVVTGARLRATKVDYRQRGARISYCGPRNDRQDAKAVATICELLEACALGGARSPGKLSNCVEAKIAARGQRGG